MLNRRISYGAALMLLAMAAPGAAQSTSSDRDLRNLEHSGGLSSADRNRLDELNADDAKRGAAVVAEWERREALLRLPPLPVERNVLLGSWRREEGPDVRIRPGNEMADVFAAISNMDSAPAGCDLRFGNGITYASSTFSIDQFAGLVFTSKVAYRSTHKQVIVAIPIPGNSDVLDYEIVGPNRIKWGNCVLLRVGAPAANAAANATTAPGNVSNAAAGPAREPIEPISRLGRGVQLHGEKDFQQALQQLLVAAQSDPNDPRVFVYLADTYRWLGMAAEATEAAERAKQLDPDAFEILR